MKLYVVEYYTKQGGKEQRHEIIVTAENAADAKKQAQTLADDALHQHAFRPRVIKKQGVD